jgi:hypothetical protein
VSSRTRFSRPSIQSSTQSLPPPTTAIFKSDDDDVNWVADLEPNFESGNGGVVEQVGERLTGRLRQPEFEAAWRAATNDPFIHSVRLHGLALPLADGKWPERFNCGRNNIKTENVEWARRAIQELAKHGAVSTWAEHVANGLGVGERPHMIMSLLVTPKSGKPGKFRLIHDCRPLNELLEKWAFKMERLSDFVKELSELDRLFSIDIQSAYHHVEIMPRFRTLLGFTFEGVDYVYNCLPFGLATSAYVFCKFTAVTARALRLSELVTALIVYVDDLGGSIGKTLDRKRMDDILKLTRSFGWVLAPEKIVDALLHRLQLLGFVLDTTTMTIEVPEARQTKLITTVEYVITHHSKVSARKICQVVGQVLSMQLALGLVCRLRSRYLILSVREAAVAGDYTRAVSVGGRALNELVLWRDQVATLAPAPMQAHLQRPDFVLECDASDHALGAIVVKAPSGQQRAVGAKFYRRLRPNEVLWGSLLRELTGYRDAVRTLARRTALEGRTISVVGDAKSATYIFANGGSQVVDKATGTLMLTEVLLDILNEADAGAYDVQFRWVRREEIQDADDLSKFVDTMDFSLTPSSLKYVLNTFGPVDVDAFAAPHNAVTQRFFSRHDAHTAEAVDGLAQNWTRDALFVLPDFHKITGVLDIIERDDAETTLIVPVWSSKPWWNRLWSGAWSPRRGKFEFLAGSALVANNDHCFFGEEFASQLLVLRTRRTNNSHSSSRSSSSAGSSSTSSGRSTSSSSSAGSSSHSRRSSVGNT